MGRNAKIVFEVFKSRLDLDQLDIKLPEFSRLSAAEIAAQQIASFAPAHLSKLLAIEPKRETGAGGLRHFDFDQPPGSRVRPLAAPSLSSSFCCC